MEGAKGDHMMITCIDRHSPSIRNCTSERTTFFSQWRPTTSIQREASSCVFVLSTRMLEHGEGELRVRVLSFGASHWAWYLVLQACFSSPAWTTV